VNGVMLPADASEIVDDQVPAGVPLRYRLVGLFEDGSARKLAEGSVQVSVAPAVGRAFPNPYTPGPGLVTVPFTVPGAPGPMEATIHDIHGRMVRRVPISAPAGGYGSVTWDGRDGAGNAVSSGIYYVRVQGQGVDRASRVVLVR
jgi:flagellar hook assembly protein FlgD